MDVIPLPPRPTLDEYRNLAKQLVKAWKSPEQDALRDWASTWIADIVGQLDVAPSEFVQHSMDGAVDSLTEYLRWKRSDSGAVKRADAQFVIARAHGFESWASFTNHLEDVGQASTETSAFERAADAVVSGDASSLRALLNEHPALVHEHSSRQHHATLLHYIAANGVEDFRQKSPTNAVEIATMLLDAGAQPDAIADTYGKDHYQTTLNLLVSSTHPASAGVQAPLVDLLIERGAAVDGVDSDSSPLITAISFGYSKAADALVRQGARIDQVTLAAAVGRLDLVRSMVIDANTLAPGTQMNLCWVKIPDTARAHIERAAVWAAMYSRWDVVDFLLDVGVNPRAMDDYRVSLLHWASARGNLSLVDRLIAAGADLELENAWGGTPLGAVEYFARTDPDADVDYPKVIAHLKERGARSSSESE